MQITLNGPWAMSLKKTRIHIKCFIRLYFHMLPVISALNQLIAIQF